MKSGAEHKGITSGEIPLAKKVPRCYQEGLLGAGYKEAENYLSCQHERWQWLVRNKLQDSNYKIKEKTARKHYDKYIELRGDNANPSQGSKIDGDAASRSDSDTLIGANDYFTERYSYTNPRVSAYDSELSGGCVINATMTLLHLCGFDAVSQDTLRLKLDYKWWPNGLAADDRKIADVLAELSQSEIKYEITWVKPHNPGVGSYLRIDNQYPFDEFRDIVKKGPVIVSVINTNDVKHTLVVDQIDANGNVCILDAHPNYASQYKVSQSTWENTKIASYVVPR